MSAITNLRLWKDTGYTDGSTEIPPVNHTLKQYDVLYDKPIYPSKDRMFSELQVPMEFLEIMDMSYLAFDLEMNTGDSKTFYGWIDDIVLQSDSDGASSCNIVWHVDYWRTFGIGAKFGSGFVVRKPSDAEDFYQNYAYRYQKVDTVTPMMKYSNSEDWWVLIAAQVKDDDKVSRVIYYLYSVTKEIHETSYKTDAEGAVRMFAPNLMRTACAGFDEHLGINPDTITGAWVIPFCPIKGLTKINDFVGTMYVVHSGSNWGVYNKPDTTNGCLVLEHTHTTPLIFDEYSGSMQPVTATELNPQIITGFMGETIGAIPYGMTVSDFTYRLKASAISAYIEIRFNDINSNAEGLCFVYPLTSLDVNSNSWSSYVMSGQREYDINQRNLRTVSDMVSGIAGQGGMGALLGGMGETAKYENGTLMSMARLNPAAIKGFGIMSVASIAGASVGMLLNDKFQEAEDKLHASQPDGILSSGLGFDTIMKGRHISMVKMKFDDRSQTIANDRKTVQGVKYNEPVTDCTDLINKGGPMQIQNLVVTGNIPVSVKRWIKDKFASGVRIIAR